MNQPTEIKTVIDALLTPSGELDATPTGRMRALDAATAAVYDEMYRILAGEVPLSPVEHEDRLGDLTALLVDLQKRTERAFKATWTGRGTSGGANGGESVHRGD